MIMPAAMRAAISRMWRWIGPFVRSFMAPLLRIPSERRGFYPDGIESQYRPGKTLRHGLRGSSPAPRRTASLQPHHPRLGQRPQIFDDVRERHRTVDRGQGVADLLRAAAAVDQVQGLVAIAVPEAQGFRTPGGEMRGEVVVAEDGHRTLDRRIAPEDEGAVARR